MVLFAHGSGSSRFSPRNNFVAGVLNGAGLATLLFDLLTKEEEAIDLRAGRLRFDISLLSQRLLAATDWLLAQSDMRSVRLGYFGASTGGAAALVAAVERPEAVRAIVCRGSRTDMAAGVLAEVAAPTLLIGGEADSQVLTWNRESFAELRGEKRLEVIPGATHLFEEPGKLEEVARLATPGRAFDKHLAEGLFTECEDLPAEQIYSFFPRSGRDFRCRAICHHGMRILPRRKRGLRWSGPRGWAIPERRCLWLSRWLLLPKLSCLRLSK